MQPEKPYICTQDATITTEDFDYRKTEARAHLHEVDPEVRKTNFLPVCEGFSIDEAKYEGSRCLECGCMDVYECALLKYARQYNVEPHRIDGEMTKVEIEREHPYIFRDNNKCNPLRSLRQSLRSISRRSCDRSDQSRF